MNSTSQTLRAGKALLFLLLLPLSLAVPKVAAASGELTERSLAQPTGWIWQTGVTPEQVRARVAQGYRLTDLEVDRTSPLRLSATFVRNQGVHKKAWWWYYGLTGEQVRSRLSQNRARLIDVEVYRVDNRKRYAVVMVGNTGAQRKGWWYYTDVSFQTLRDRVSRNRARLVDLDTYVVNGQRRFAAVMIANRGTDRKAWWWYTNLTPAEIRQKRRDHRARIVDLEPRSGGRFAVVLERNSGVSSWWYRGITRARVSELAAQNGARLIDVERYRVNGRTRFAVLMLDNSNPATARMRRFLDARTDGVFGFRLVRTDGAVRASLQADRVFYPASTIKVLQHFHLMLAVQRGELSLDRASVRKYPARSDSCSNTHGGQSFVVESLRQATRRMMRNSDNQSTNALQEFFGGGRAHRGRAAINDSVRGIAGLSRRTALQHKFECGGPANDPANAMTLRDIVAFYARVSRGELLTGASLATFYATMLNQSNDRFIDRVIDDEARPGVDIAAFKRQVRMAHKAGNWGLDRSIAGWVRLPTATGVRDFSYAIFIEDASRVDVGIRTAAAELLRKEIRSALATFD